MKKIIEKIENLDISFWSLVSVFCSSLVLRVFFENFVAFNNLGKLIGFTSVFFHYVLWYANVIGGLAVIVTFFSRKKLVKVLNLVSFCSFVILLPLVIDFLFYNENISYNYIIGGWAEVFRHYYTFFIYSSSFGLGIKTEIAIVLLVIFYYIFSQERNFLKAFLAAVVSYTFIFGMIILPNIIYLISSIFTSLPSVSLSAVSDFLSPTNYDDKLILSRSYLTDVVGDTVRLSMLKNMIAILFGQILLYFFLIVLSILFYLRFGLKKAWYFLCNFRWLRIAHYFILLGFGLMLGQNNINSISSFSNIYDWAALISALLSLLFAWLFAVWENDEADRDIDELSNNNRPLTKKIFTDTEWKNIKWVFFILSLVSGILSSYSTFSVVLVFIIIYHIYSVYPLRLKRFPIISSALIALNACLAFLIGFFLVAGVAPLNILPTTVLFGIFLFYLCTENIKNLKDVAGDTKDRILTIPVIFGEKKGQIITWLVVFLGSFAIPLLWFPTKSVAMFAPIFAALSYFLIVRKNYKERPLMLLYLGGILLIMFL